MSAVSTVQMATGSLVSNGGSRWASSTEGGVGGPATVVYLHSASGEGAGLAFLENLAAGRRDVARRCFPGFGVSEGIEHIEDIEDAAFHVLDVLDRLRSSIGRTSSGSSLGGWMAAELAVALARARRRLVLVNPVGLYVEGSPITEIFGRTLDELADRAVRRSRASRRAAHADDRGSDARSVRHTFRPAASLHTGRGGDSQDRMESLPAQSEAARSVGSDNRPDSRGPRGAGRDRPAAHAEAFVQGIPRARLAVLDKTAHLAVIERPDEASELVAAHLDQTDAP